MAFGIDFSQEETGHRSLRERAAIAAMQGLMARSKAHNIIPYARDEVAAEAVALADALVAALTKENP